MSKELGIVLKDRRRTKSLTVKYVSNYLINKGFKASIKTIYSWECGNSEPAPAALLTLCEIYEIDNVLETFGYATTETLVPLPEYSDEENDLIMFFRSLSDKEKDLFKNFMLTFNHLKNNQV